MRAIRVFIMAVLLLCAACDRSTPAASDAGGDSALRIISLSPAISRTLVDFELADRVVGRTPYCASIDQSIPVVGSLLDVDYERLLQLKPTHVLVQPSLAQGVEPRLRSLAEKHNWTIGEFPSLNTVDDVEAMILALPALLFSDGADERTASTARAAQLTNDIAEALHPAGENAWRGSVLLVGGIDPLYIFGKETYLHDVLTALGGTNVAHVSGWAELSLEDVIRLDPEAIVLVRETPVEDDDVKAALGPLASLSVRAVKDNRLAVLVHPDANLPSSGVVGVAAALREVLVSLKQSEKSE